MKCSHYLGNGFRRCFGRSHRARMEYVQKSDITVLVDSQPCPPSTEIAAREYTDTTRVGFARIVVFRWGSGFLKGMPLCRRCRAREIFVSVGAQDSLVCRLYNVSRPRGFRSGDAVIKYDTRTGHSWGARATRNRCTSYTL